ncbi:hypothetical protein [Limimaricola sp. AA108-03]|uniref:hypothetical protein n=1 Tax=Limimaricola sp. AA108-03 TaxID=3425945 RepID=UPI003D787434
MFDTPYDARSVVHAYVYENLDGLQNAALLLGGYCWLERTQRLIDQLHRSPTITRHLQRELMEILDLLLLEHVHDEDRPESGYFAKLDPAQPYVEEICLLAEGLADAIDLVSKGTERKAQTATLTHKGEI